MALNECTPREATLFSFCLPSSSSMVIKAVQMNGNKQEDSSEQQLELGKDAFSHLSSSTFFLEKIIMML